MTSVSANALQQDKTTVSLNIRLSYTSSVWSGKTFSRPIHGHKWCLFSYWSLWKWNGWLLFVNLKISHHHPRWKFCNIKLPKLAWQIGELHSAKPSDTLKSSDFGQKNTNLKNRHVGFSFIPSCVPDPKTDKLWVHLMIFGLPGICVTREVDVCVQMAISWDRKSYIHSWQYLQDMTGRRLLISAS